MVVHRPSVAILGLINWWDVASLGYTSDHLMSPTRFLSLIYSDTCLRDVPTFAFKAYIDEVVTFVVDVWIYLPLRLS